MNGRLLFLLLPLLLAACGQPPAGTLKPLPYRVDGQERVAFASQPRKTLPGDPAVILITPDLRIQERRTNSARTNGYLELYDHYLNNAGLALIRFDQRGRGPSTIEATVRECRALLSTLRKKHPGRRLTLLTFGSAAAAGLLLSGALPDLPLVMVGPPARKYDRILRWRLLEEPTRHFTSCFDMDGDKIVSREEFRQDTYRVRDELFRGIRFGQLDRDNDGRITASDFALANRRRYTRLLSALSGGAEGESTIKSLLGPEESGAWITSLIALSRTNTTTALLRRVRAPVFILHGGDDRRIPASEARLLQKAGIPRLRVHIEGGHDHELNWSAYAVRGRLPRGIFFLLRTLFSLAGEENAGNSLHDP